MQLHLLRKTSCLTIYYDSGNDWLFLDWEGDLSLLGVQEACLALAACFLQRPYSRVLNSNEQIAGVNWSVAPWLATEFLPHMALAGIQHVAWVHSSSLLGQHMVQTVLNWLPGPLITSFSDLEDATAWLKHLHPDHTQGFILPVRSPATQAKLEAEMRALVQRLATKQPKLAATQWLAA